MNNNSTDISREESNKLIAEFMGNKPYEDSRYGTLWQNPASDGIRNKTSMGLEYHSSWDWLMPVWGKFRIWCWQNIGYNSDFEKYKEMFMSGVFNNNCQQSCEAMVKAILWYNLQPNIKNN